MSRPLSYAVLADIHGNLPAFASVRTDIEVQGQRLALNGYQAGQSLTSRFLLEGERRLAVTANGQTTYYLNRVGEYQADWRYCLADGMGSVRQLTDGQG